MDSNVDTTLARKWLSARRRLQRLADAVLGESADQFLYQGKLYGEGLPGQYISGLLGSPEGCEAVLWLVERLDANEPLEAVIVDECGWEPDESRRPVLWLSKGRLSYLWPNGQIELLIGLL